MLDHHNNRSGAANSLTLRLVKIGTPRRASMKAPRPKAPRDLPNRSALGQKNRGGVAEQGSPNKRRPNSASLKACFRTAPPERSRDLLFAPIAGRLRQGF